MAFLTRSTSYAISLAAAATLAGIEAPATAQPQSSKLVARVSEDIAQAPSNSKQLQQFTRTFQAGVLRGCLANPPKSLRNSRGYCNCYANSFVNRYQPEDLVAIDQRANTSAGANLVTLMMAPEIRACRSQNQ